MIQRMEVPGRFPSLNEFYRMDRHEQARVKRECDELVAWCAKRARLKPCSRPVRIAATWVEPNRRRDLDNIRFGMKFVQDGLVKARVLYDDGPRQVVGHSDAYAYDSMRPRIEVTIEEVGQ